MIKLYEIALTDGTKIIINPVHIESLETNEDGSVAVGMMSGEEYIVVPHTLNLALQHSGAEIFRLTDAPAEEPVKEVQGELVD